MPERLMIFIDGANVSQGMRRRYGEGENIDYVRLVSELKADMNLIASYYFDGIPDPKIDRDAFDKKSEFLGVLRSHNINVITKLLRYRENGFTTYQKGVDVELVIKLLVEEKENHYDLAILVSGDNDFAGAINYVRRAGRRVWVASFANSLGNEIVASADKVIQLDDMFNKIRFDSLEKLVSDIQKDVRAMRSR